MKRLTSVTLWALVVVAGLALIVPAVQAQERGRPPSEGSKGSQGTAVPRGGGPAGGGPTMGSGSTGGSSMGSGSMGSGSAGGASTGSGGYATSPRYRGAGNSSARGGRSESAVRRSGESGGYGGIGANTPQAVPRESRPRGDRPSMGTAVPRGSNPPPRGGDNSGNYYGGYYGNYWNNYYGGYYGSSWYSPYPYWSGYYGWNPWSYGWYGSAFYWDPFWGGVGYPGYYGGNYGSGYYQGGGYYPEGQFRLMGELKLKVTPKDAEVYIDGYYVGSVDDFDGAFQSLRLQAEVTPGMAHRIELRRQGYEPVTFEVRITPGHTITYRGDLQPLPRQEPIR